MAVLVAALALASAQRRRERRPVLGTASRPLFAAREEPAPLVGSHFMPDFDWSEPDWSDESSWGFKESKKVAVEPEVEAREYREPGEEARDYLQSERGIRQRPRWQQGEVEEGAQRRSDLGRRRRPGKVRGEGEALRQRRPVRVRGGARPR